MWATTIAFTLLLSGCIDIAYDTTRSIQAMRRRQDRQHEAEDNAAAESRRERENAEIRATGRRLELERRLAHASSGPADTTDGSHDALPPTPPTCVERRRAMMLDAQQRGDVEERTRILSGLPRCEDLPDALDRATIAAAIAGVSSRVASCGAKAGAKGEVKIHVVVGSDGRVADVSVDRAPEVELAMCVVAAVRSAAFAATRSGGSFSYPFRF